MYHTAYKYRAYPSSEQRLLMAKTFGCCRYVYNWALGLKRAAWTDEKRSVSTFELSRLLTLHKKEKPFLGEVDSKALTMTLRDLDAAYTNFFKLGRGFPRFRSKYDHARSYRTYQYIELDYRLQRIRLPKLGWLPLVCHRPPHGKVKFVTVSCTASGQYYVSVTMEHDGDLPAPPPVDPARAVGIDLGVKNLVTLSDGTKFAPNAFLRGSLRRLKRRQRALSRKQRGSRNYEKQRVRVARAHARISRQREDYVNRVADAITRRPGCTTVCMEDLNVRGMTRNRRLARAVADASMGMLRVRLQQKCRERGINLLTIGRYEPSSKKCHCCGFVYKPLRLSQRAWTCPACGAHHDRDVNAAINIKEIGASQGSLPRCTREVKPVERRTAGRRKAVGCDVRDAVKQEKDCGDLPQMPTVQEILPNQV